MYYTYLMRSKKNRNWYTGFAKDLRKRFKQHNLGKSSYTKSRRPYELIYYEACINEDDARSRELFLKSGPGKRYINNRLKRFLSRTTNHNMLWLRDKQMITKSINVNFSSRNISTLGRNDTGSLTG